MNKSSTVYKKEKKNKKRMAISTLQKSMSLVKSNIAMNIKLEK